MMNEIKDNEAARAMQLHIQEFEPADRKIVVSVAAKNMSSMVNRTIADSLIHLTYPDNPFAGLLAHPFRLDDLKSINQIINIISEYGFIPSHGLTGALKVIGDIISEDEDLKSGIEDLGNMPLALGLVFKEIASLLNDTVSDLVARKVNGLTVNYAQFLKRLAKRIYDIPVWMYEELVNLVLMDQIDSIAARAAYKVVQSTPAADVEIMQIELDAKEEVIDAYKSINPENSGCFDKVDKLMEMIEKLFDADTLNKIFEILNKPSNESMERAFTVFGDPSFVFESEDVEADDC